MVFFFASPTCRNGDANASNILNKLSPVPVGMYELAGVARPAGHADILTEDFATRIPCPVARATEAGTCWITLRQGPDIDDLPVGASAEALVQVCVRCGAFDV